MNNNSNNNEKELEMEFTEIHSGENLDDFFKAETETETETETTTETTKESAALNSSEIGGEFVARIIFAILKTGLNIWSRKKTGESISAHGFLLKQESEDFVEILTHGFDSGQIKKPPSSLIFVLFLLSLFSEPIYFLITYKKSDNKEKIETNEHKPKKRAQHKHDCQCIVCKQSRRRK